ncbi:MAG: ketopantoate reductase family protein [Acidimicrobiia bacterium]
MRFVIYGVGAIGGVLAAAFADSGTDVVGIARGRQLEALKAEKLTMHSPSGTVSVDIEVVGTPSEVDFGSDDVVLLTLKSQGTESARRELAAAAGPDLPLVCVQNGVANERTMARSFRRVYGAVIMMPATFVEPGEVTVYGEPRYGTIDLGAYPSGGDDTAKAVAAALVAANFDSRAIPDIMRWKYGKLMGNLTNAIEAVCGLGTRNGELGRIINAESHSVMAAAGIEFSSEAEEDDRRAGNVELSEVEGIPRQGASSWQSLARGSGSIESDYLNGEIALLGRMHGVPTPANDLIQSLANQVADSAQPPGAISEAEVLRRLGSEP